MLFRSDYLSQFHPAPSPQVPSFVSALTERMACRVLVFFVRHASLVRPLPNDGKLRLAKVGLFMSLIWHCLYHDREIFEIWVVGVWTPLHTFVNVCAPFVCSNRAQCLADAVCINNGCTSSLRAHLLILHAAETFRPLSFCFAGRHQKIKLWACFREALCRPKLALDSSECCLQDMGELEAGVGQSVYPLDRLGLPFNILRAFRRLLFLETSEVPASPLLRELPPSVVLHHLYSRAPAALQSPHVRHRFTPAQVCPMLSVLAFAYWILG